MKKPERTQKENTNCIYVSTQYWGLRTISPQEYESMTPIQKIYCSLIPLDVLTLKEDSLKKLTILQILAVKKY